MSVFFPENGSADPEDGNADEPGTNDQATAPGPRRRRRARWVVALLAVLVGVVVVSVVAATSYVATVSHSVSENLQRGEDLPPDVPTAAGEAPRPIKPAEAAKAVNYVLMGSDSLTGDAGQGRSDVLMVLHLSGDRRSAALISFPRDLYVSIPGHGKNKINAAYAFGGPQLTVRTLEGLLGTRMDHTALIDFDGFISLTDTLGGVTVNNPHASASHGYSFPTGRITVSGAEALAYVRERKQLPNGDLDRAERQRLVARAILTKGLSQKTLTNPVAFNKFAGGLAKQVTVDPGLSMGELRRTALSIRFTPSDIDSMQAPIKGFGTSATHQSIDVVDTSAMADLAEALRDDRLADYRAEHPEG
ncbi:LCP family protein [uncultured Friedmanniella sp.]|uniref:LCP family protein n=1 Tax=uncultured Friedmanniella sp. TaxID=335381 RepID=UPI0035C96DAE